MKPPKGADVERVYPHGRMGTGTDPKPTAAADLEDDARWQAEEDAAADLIAGETPAPRVVEPNSIDSADLAHRVPFDDDRDLIADRPSAAEAHAADVGALLARLQAKVNVLEVTNARWRADAHAMVVKLGEMAKNCEAAIVERDAALARAQRPRKHGRIVSLLLWLESDR